jgi:hypothetical protein
MGKRMFGSLTELMEHLKMSGSRGGKKSAANLTRAQRSARARKAARARWGKPKAKRARAKKGA